MSICEQCGKEFKNDLAVRMHKARVHSRSILTPGQLGVIKRGRKRLSPVQVGKLRREQYPEREAIYQRVVNEYVIDGKIRWAKALQENPEWRKTLKGVSDASRYSRTFTILRSRQKQANMAQALTPEASAPETQALVVRPRQQSLRALVSDLSANGQSHGVVHCPKCGEHIALWNKVAEVIHGFKGQQ